MAGLNNGVNIGIIIQARMGSTRLPGKILMPIGNKLLLEHIVDALKTLKHKTTVVIATSDLPQDNKVEDFCRNHYVECFRGSELNVLERYYLCAKKYGFGHIIRITGDNPFYDIEEIDNLIDLHLNQQADYSQSHDTLPIGVGTEIFTFQALERSYKEGHKPHHIEHVDEYILEHPEIFKCELLKVPDEKNKPNVRLTVDTKEDYEKACKIAESGIVLTTENILKLDFI